jgi:membrane protease YdiL (CAAX protease family)
VRSRKASRASRTASPETTRSSSPRRRRAVVVATALVGAVVLAFSLRIDAGSDSFYLATLALAAVWVVGALASGPVRWGRPTVSAVAVGLGLAGVFVVGALVVREIGPLERQVSKVLDYAEQGSLPLLVLVTAVNGVAEEMFFRGAMYDAVASHPVAWTALANAVAVAGTGNWMLAFAALLLGVIVGLERRATGGITAPMLTHVSWSVTMLLALPALFG